MERSILPEMSPLASRETVTVPPVTSVFAKRESAPSRSAGVLDAYTSERIVTGQSSENFGFAAGFVSESIVGFAAGGSGTDARFFKRWDVRRVERKHSCAPIANWRRASKVVITDRCSPQVNRHHHNRVDANPRQRISVRLEGNSDPRQRGAPVSSGAPLHLKTSETRSEGARGQSGKLASHVGGRRLRRRDVPAALSSDRRSKKRAHKRYRVFCPNSALRGQSLHC